MAWSWPRRLGTGVAVLTIAAAGATGASGISASGKIATIAGASGPAKPALTASRFGRGFAETRPAKIVVARADGSGSHILTTGWYSYISPDGSQVAVVDGDVNFTNTRLELYASGGGAPTHAMAINSARIVWSPDSTKLAYVEYNRSARKPSQLRLVDAGTAATTTLATGFFDSQVSFSPDSASLAYVQKPAADPYFSARSTLRVVDLATRAVRTIRSSRVASPAWGPTEIAFATLKPRGRNFAFNVAAVQPDGSGFRQLTSFRPTRNLFGPYPVAWSADGKRLLAGMVGEDWTALESYAVDPIRGGVRLIAHQVSPAGISRDGRFVIGQTGDAATTGLAGSDVVRVPWAGGTKRVLLRQAVEPSFNG